VDQARRSTRAIAFIGIVARSIDRIIPKCRRRSLHWNSPAVPRRRLRAFPAGESPCISMTIDLCRGTSRVMPHVDDSYHSRWRMHEIATRSVGRHPRCGLQRSTAANLDPDSAELWTLPRRESSILNSHVQITAREHIHTRACESLSYKIRISRTPSNLSWAASRVHKQLEPSDELLTIPFQKRSSIESIPE